MDSLRDKHIKVLRNIPSRETTSVAVQDGPAEVDPLQEDIVPLPLPNDPAAAERFDPAFRDPHFPYKVPSYSASKRVFDIIFASLALIIASPVLLIVAILIKATDRGPVFFKQVRVGRGGRYFWCLKFRSMCVDAEEKKKLLMHLNEVSGPVFKMKRDPRVTRVGAVIRKLSIDEFPQFFNVLLGEMSIVGPRPPLPSEVSLYNARERGRLAVVPGITCIWQVSGRSDVSFERWVELDLEYIEKMSMATDIRILLQTVPAVMKGSGAR